MLERQTGPSPGRDVRTNDLLLRSLVVINFFIGLSLRAFSPGEGKVL